MYFSTAFALALASLAAPNATLIQSGPWEPWYGCWRAAESPDQTVCIVPAGSGIRLVTLEDGTVRGDARVYADGVARQRAQDGCTMDEWSRWSDDRERVFLTSELTCDGRVTRRSQGILAFTSPDEWVSVQTISGEEEGSALRTVRFTPALGVRLPASLAGLAPGRALRLASIDPVDESDVVEATDVLDPETVQEWLRISGAPYQVTDSYEGAGNSSALEDLAYVSRPIEYRTVNIVRILEPSWCIYGSCSWLRSAWCWDPWGYDRFAWRVIHPVVYWRPPALLHIGINIGSWRPIRIARYDGWGRGANWWRYDYPDRWRGGRTIGHAVGYAPGRGTVGSGGYRPPYGDARPSDSGPGRGTVTGEPRAGSVTRGNASGEPRSGTGTRGTGTVRGEETRSGSTGRGTAIVRRTDENAGTSRGTTVERRGQLPASGTRGTVSGGGYSPGTSTGRGSATVRPTETRGPTVMGSDSRGSAIVRGSESRGTVQRGSSSGRSDASSIGSYRGSAVGRSEPRASGSGAAARSSEPRMSTPRAPSVSRGSGAPSGSSRGSVSPRGFSSGGGAARGTARPRQ